MKNIDFTSDIHSSFIYKNFKDIFGRNGVLTQKSEYLVIAGDLNEEIGMLQKTLDDIIRQTTYKKIILTFGNHDLWYSQKDYIFLI